MYDATHTIQSFLEATAAKQPAPGGGSVTALVGALSAAIGEMVLNYSVGKKSLAPHEPILRSSLYELSRARKLLLTLMAEDQSAYETLTALRKLPENSPERVANEAPTLLACIRVPQAMAAVGVAVLELCDRLADKVNRFLLSDLAVSAELAMATVRCGLYNVRVNLTDLKDTEEKGRFERSSAQTLAHATALIRVAMPKIWKNA